MLVNHLLETKKELEKLKKQGIQTTFPKVKGRSPYSSYHNKRQIDISW